MSEALLAWVAELLDNAPTAYEDIAAIINESPGRINAAYRELLAGYNRDPVFELKRVLELPPAASVGVVVVHDIHYVSMCAHHLLPFFGKATVAYEPGEAVLGLGKLPRVVDTLARRFQLQETLTDSLADLLFTVAESKGSWVSLTGTHVCVSHRGPASPDAVTTTWSGRGTLQDGLPPGAIRATC